MKNVFCLVMMNDQKRRRTSFLSSLTTLHWAMNSTMIAKIPKLEKASKQDRELAEITRLELRLERWAMPKIRKEMNIIARQAMSDYSNGGIAKVRAQALKDGQARIAETLKPVYDKTLKEMKKVLSKHHDPKAVEQVEKLLTRKYEAQARKAGRQIAKSTENIMKRVIERETENGSTQDVIEKELRKKLKRSNSVRSEVIAQAEIGSVSNEQRFDVIKQAGENYTFKEWVTYRDSKVRDHHQDAEGQLVYIDEPFLVDGEKLPYPRWRGARPSNRCRCRCKIKMVKV